MTLDPRLHAFRADLADARLRDRVSAEAYVEGAPARVATAVCAFRDQPSRRGEVTATKLLGEPLLVFENRAGWIWAQSQLDGYVGYAPNSRIAHGSFAPNLRVIAPRTHLYAAPNLKTPPPGWAPLTARLESDGAREQNGFRALAGGGWVYAGHVAEGVDNHDGPPDWAEDWVAVAEAFLHTPYLWGGESVEGVDCSGLIHVALDAAGLPAPRDTDMQAAEIGESLPEDATLRRGDLVFWNGHVGVMRDDKRLLHANAWSMSTISEPLATVLARFEARGVGPVTVVRRPSPPVRAAA